MTLFLALLSCKGGSSDDAVGSTGAGANGPGGPYDSGRVVLHRLNRTEYDNTVRDLLGTTLTPARDFPTDDMVGGFDNIASNLTISPLHAELYELAAQQLADELAGVPLAEGDAVAHRAEGEGADVVATVGAAFGSAWNLWSVGDLSTGFDVPADGTYRITARVWASQAGPDPALVTIGHDGVPEPAVEVAGDGEGAAETLELEVELQAGSHTATVSFLNDYYDMATGEDRNLFVDWIDVTGPIDAPTGGNPIRDRFVTCDPADLGDAECVEVAMRELAWRAWRRPVTDEEIARLMGVADAVLADGGTFDDALKWTTVAVLLSPDFLYRVEIDPQPTSADTHPLSDWEVASRLSYFLWSSMPDDELFDAAGAGELQTTEQVMAQVERMMLDPKASELVDNFGGQWLFIRGIDTASKDPVVFPDFDEPLRASMKEEMTRFFESFVFGGRDLRELLTATEGEVDAILADHYGVPHGGSGWVPVDLEGHGRGGLLGQAGLLAVNAYPARTSPVVRGKFVLGQLLCDEPPPPPPNIPTLDDDATAESLREQLEQHRANPVCASCHESMDPIGFALENFDSVGVWREEDGGQPIDASGVLPTGESFVGMREMADVIAGDPRFTRCVTEKLLTYAIGRIPEESDEPFITAIEQQFAAGGYTFEALATAVATSPSFRTRRGEP